MPSTDDDTRGVLVEERTLKNGDIAKIMVLEGEQLENGRKEIHRFIVQILDREDRDKIKLKFTVPSLISPFCGVRIKLEKGNKDGKYKEFDFRVVLVCPEEYTPEHARLLFDFYTRYKKNRENGEKIFNMIQEIYNGTPAEEVVENNKDLIENINKTPGMDIRAFLKLLELIFIQEDLNYPPDKKNSTGKYYEGRDKTFSLFKKVKNGKTPIEALMEADLSIKLDPNKFSITINNLIGVLVDVYNNENNVIEALEELGIKIGR